MAVESVYLEPTIISYLTARNSRDLIVRGHQRLTHKWWDQRFKYHLCISELVLSEISRGDPGAAAKRLALVENLTILPVTSEAKSLAAKYVCNISELSHAPGDALHISIATVHELEYMLTWNCAHIANAHSRRSLELLNNSLGKRSTVICTPEELMDVQQALD